MRILQVDTERGWRGGQRQSLLLSIALRRRGHQCIIVARRGQPLAERARAAGIDVVEVTPWSEFAPFTAARLRRIIRDDKVDIVHAQASHALGLSALALRGTRARLIVTRHLARPPRPNALTRWKYAQVSAAIAVSAAAADAMQTSGIARDRIAVIPGGVETDRQPTPASRETLSQLGARSNPSSSPLLAIFIGALVDQKDPLTFVRAMKVVHDQAPDVQAVMAGDGPLRPDVEREIAKNGLETVVHLAGFRDDVDALMAASRVLVMSSRFEGLPLVVMDAFVLGVPVVATAGSGIPEAVRDGDTGLLVPVGDDASLGQAIARVLTDPALASRLAAAGRAEAANYSIERTAERTLAVYQRALGEPAVTEPAVTRR